MHNGSNKNKTINSQIDHYEYEIKCVIIGDCANGKSSILLRHINGFFKPTIKPSLSNDLFINKIKIGENEIIVNFWDTCGHERMRSITNQYMRNSHVILIVYDLSSKYNEKNVKYWNNFIKNYDNSIVIHIGNKLDLKDDKKFVEIIENNIELYKKNAKVQCCEYISVSAKTNEGIENLFKLIIKKIIEEIEHNKIKKNVIPKKNLNNSNLLIEKPPNKNKNKTKRISRKKNLNDNVLIEKSLIMNKMENKERKNNEKIKNNKINNNIKIDINLNGESNKTKSGFRWCLI